ncbi:MAG: cytochrome c [Alphaproteobacteria bacterium]
MPKPIIVIAVVLAVIVGALGYWQSTKKSMPDMAQAAAAIKQRVDVMKDFGQQTGIVKAFVTEDKGDAAAVKAAAEKMAADTKSLPAMFPAGSGRGTVDPKMTRALPKIWEDMPGFQAAVAKMEAEAAALSAAADTGDKAVIAAAFDSLGKNGCGGCHSAYRGPKAE